MSNTSSNFFAVLRVILARLRFLAVFVVAGLLVGYWDTIKNYVDKWTRPEVPPDSLAAVSDIEYYCAMHPTVIRDHPGDCPICGMPLIKRKKGGHEVLPADVMARVQLSPQRVAMANIATTAVEYRQLSREVSAVGVLDYDETRLAQLSSRVAGRADRLMLQYVGQPVKKGDIVYAIYSPEVYTGIRDYLQARDRVNKMGEDKGAGAEMSKELRADAADVYNASMQRLLLWGVTREQLDKLDDAFDKSGTIPTHLEVQSPIDGIVVEKNIIEGGYLGVGSVPFTIADLSQVWLKVRIYEADIPLVHVGQTARITVNAMGNERIEGKVQYVDFRLDPQTRTLAARIDVPNPGLKLRPGMYADVNLEVPITRESLATKRPVAVVPATAPALSPYSAAYASALEKYLFAQSQLASDRVEGVSQALHEAVSRLAPLSADVELKPLVDRLTAAVHPTMGKDLAATRELFKEISAAMIDLGHAAKLPLDAPPISVFRCPMKQANWLQSPGSVANPYYGSQMLDCGSPVEPLPRVEVVQVAAAAQGPAGRVLAVPRSAVIDTGRREIVYVQSAAGVFDMKEVKLGPLAGQWYPLIAGLTEGEQVATRGAFLIDAENRLNPAQASAAESVKGSR